MLERVILPKLGKPRLKGVGQRDLQDLHIALREQPYRANRVLSLLSKMFSLAVDWGWIEKNPVRGIQRYAEHRRERWLNLDELGRFLAALNEYPDQNAAAALRLLIYTGARQGEVLRADWSDFDVEAGVWTKPSAHTKQKKVEHLPLSTLATQMLLCMEGRAESGALFPGLRGQTRVTLRRPFDQVCKAAGLVKVISVQGRKRKLTRYKPTVRIHDLRHTFASHLVSSNEALYTGGKLLGHTDPQTTARYAHLSQNSLRGATESLGPTAQAASQMAG